MITMTRQSDSKITQQQPINVAVIGTVGVPANYGGFETLVEQLIDNRKDPDIRYTVYCSGPHYADRLDTYKGANLRYIPLKANGMQSIPYDILSMIRAAREADILLVLGVSGCVFLPLLRLFCKKRIVVNIDGLEHRREKWKPYIKKFLKYSEKCAVRNADTVIADNQGIADYVKEEYGMEAVMIPYGGDQAETSVDPKRRDEILAEKKLAPKDYSLALCRIEPENNVRMILEAFSRRPDEKLIFVGNWNNSAYGQELRREFAKFPNIRMEDAIYDLNVVNTLRSNCKYYLHGHSAGGTNPSLVEAMFFGVPLLAYDVVYNRHSTEDSAIFFSDADSLSKLIGTITPEQAESCGAAMREIADRRYRWSQIAGEYESIVRP